MKRKATIPLLILICIAILCLYLFYGLHFNWDYALERRAYKVAAMIIVGICIGYASLIFQTLTQNKILTPAIMGFEAVYMLFQTMLVYAYGDATYKVLQQGENFLLSTLLMVGFAGILYWLIFKREQKNLYFLLLIGIVSGTLLSTMASFFQLIIDPNEFLIIEGKMFASFNQINTPILAYTAITSMGIIALNIRNHRYLDVLALGKANAVNLGVNYQKTTATQLIVIAVLIAVSTALVGPLTFLGLLVTNVTYELFKTYKHNILLPACAILSIITIVTGQFLVEHLLNYGTTVSIIVNFIGGIYFLYLILRNKK